MNIKILDKEIELDNNQDGISELFYIINNLVKKNGLYFSHLIVDSIEVVDDYENYLLKYIDQISHVEVVLLNSKELLNEALLSCKDYLAQALSEIEKLADKFYQGENEETWKKFDQMLEGLQWIVQMVSALNSNKDFYNTIHDSMEIEEKLSSDIAELEDAVTQNDLILIGDIINYEILPTLNSLNLTVHKIVENEVLKDDIN